MRFIPEDQFNNADEKIKDEVYKWWEENISIGDLFYNNIGYCIDGYVSETQSKEAILGNTTPLLTVGQMIEFLEWKTGGSTEIKITCVNSKETLLETLWEEVQEVCKKI